MSHFVAHASDQRRINRTLARIVFPNSADATHIVFSLRNLCVSLRLCGGEVNRRGAEDTQRLRRDFPTKLARSTGNTPARRNSVAYFTIVAGDWLTFQTGRLVRIQ